MMDLASFLFALFSLSFSFFHSFFSSLEDRFGIFGRVALKLQHLSILILRESFSDVFLVTFIGSRPRKEISIYLLVFRMKKKKKKNRGKRRRAPETQLFLQKYLPRRRVVGDSNSERRIALGAA